MENILEKIDKSALRFLEPLTPEETYKIICEEAKHLMNGQDASIILDVKGELTRVYSTTKDIADVKWRKKGFTYKAFTQNKTIVSSTSELKKSHPESIESGIHSVVFIPLSYKNKPIGVLQVRSTVNQEFTKEKLEILKLLGSMATMAIKKTQLYDETKKALETRDLFISMAAHEFRTPLTTINGYMQLLQHKMKDKNTTESRWINHVAWETIRLTQLVNELLEVNKIKSGHFQYILKECNIKEIIKRAIESFHFKYPNRIVILTDKIKDNGQIVIGDFNKLLQVFNNLLDNAAKFSPTNTPIGLYIKSDKSHIMVCIKDKGKGIDKSEIPLIFEGFYKSDKSIENGMGIGLFLSKNIIKNHHGLLQLNSKLNKGTTAEVHLPKAKL